MFQNVFLILSQNLINRYDITTRIITCIYWLYFPPHLKDIFVLTDLLQFLPSLVAIIHWKLSVMPTNVLVLNIGFYMSALSAMSTLKAH